jgi:hypothetical protein
LRRVGVEESSHGSSVSSEGEDVVLPRRNRRVLVARDKGYPGRRGRVVVEDVVLTVRRNEKAEKGDGFEGEEERSACSLSLPLAES